MYYRFQFENEENTLAAASIATQTKLYRELIDVDNSLDDPSLDYWNVMLDERIAAIIQ
jgi:hypothetical protein